MIKYFLIAILLTSCVTVTHNHYSQPVKRDTVYLPCKQLHLGIFEDTPTIRYTPWFTFPVTTTPYVFDTVKVKK